jgi:transcription elongation GreA/GreB family factor
MSSTGRTGSVLEESRRMAAPYAHEVVREDATVGDETLAGLGTWCRVQDGDLIEWWRIVGSEDADALRRLISKETPLARALIGHRAGEQVQVRGPDQPRTVRLLAIRDADETPLAAAGR